MHLLTNISGIAINELDINITAPGTVGEYWLHLINNGIGEPTLVPIMIARGKYDGPVLGITAAIHGNELNGIPVIQRLFRNLNVHSLHGTVVGVLVVNVPGLIREQRRFIDGVDLNRIAPGKPDGNVSEVYINRVVERILSKFDYLIDLHTASFGRVNSWYIRADMTDEATAKMARLQSPDIILHNKPNDGTFRGAASALGIKAITLELKDPHIFQFDVIDDALEGIYNVIYDLQMLEGKISLYTDTTILCKSSYWIHTDEGGILHVYPNVCQEVKKGDLIAEVRTIFGKPCRQYHAPEDGIIIGKSVDPINPTGSRILHLGTGVRRISLQESSSNP
jgi:predicted deacylase